MADHEELIQRARAAAQEHRTLHRAITAELLTSLADALEQSEARARRVAERVWSRAWAYGVDRIKRKDIDAILAESEEGR